MQYIMAPEHDGIRIGAFVRTGCLITMLVSEEYDKKIRPQGTTPSSFQVPVDATLLADSVERPVPQAEEDIAVATRQMQDLIDEENGDEVEMTAGDE